MNITMTADADHRVSSGKSIRYRKGRTYPDVAKTIGDALIERKVARVATEAELKAHKEAK